MPFTVEITNHPSGDQLPLLIDQDGQPIPWPNEFILGRRYLAANTLVRNLREIAIFWRWLEREQINLAEVVSGARRLGEAQISTSLIDFLRRDQNTAKKVRKISIVPGSFNKRLITIRQFIDWCFDVEIGLSTNVGPDYERLHCVI
ncbi:hypothetical protein [Herbaspirillum sp. CF444]|uniref:hypothetical protein n=1 Tax=Herbaspirillum sp. CF444 TaxID=1144319 RepID=UPI0005565D08|nr:hypothetical protein [Herbaspirillum sp. CF444]